MLSVNLCTLPWLRTWANSIMKMWKNRLRLSLRTAHISSYCWIYIYSKAYVKKSVKSTKTYYVQRYNLLVCMLRQYGGRRITLMIVASKEQGKWSQKDIFSYFLFSSIYNITRCIATSSSRMCAPFLSHSSEGTMVREKENISTYKANQKLLRFFSFYNEVLA